MPRKKLPRCELARRLRTPKEPFGKKPFRYWAGRVRLCLNDAIAKVRFVGQARDLYVCRSCFDREALEHPADWLEFEMLEPSHSRRPLGGASPK